MKIYSIRYFETKGIEEFFGGTCENVGGIIYWSLKGAKYYENRFERIGGTAFLDRSEAISAAKAKIMRTLGALDRRREKLLCKIGELQS